MFAIELADTRARRPRLHGGDARPAACSSARAACTATPSVWPRRSRCPRRRPRRGSASSSTRWKRSHEADRHTGSAASPGPAPPSGRARSTTRRPAQVSGHVDLATGEEVDAAVAAAQEAFPAWRDTLAGQARERSCSRFRELVHRQPRRAGRADQLRARQGRAPTPPARWRAGWRSWSSPAASRTCSRAASPRTSRPAWTPTPSASRWASSPASRRSTSRRWCRCGCSRWRSRAGNTFVLKPSEKDPSTSVQARRAVAGGGAARRRLQRRARRQGRRGRRCWRTPTCGR